MVFFDGLLTTFALTMVAIGGGTAAGFALGISVSVPTRFPFLRTLLLFLVDCTKAMPPLLLLLLFYYWLPYVLGLTDAFWLAALALAVGLCAFVADVARHAIAGVPRPLVEACYAVGMTPRTAFQSIVLPEAVRSMLPTLGLLYMDIFKLSSLASVIAVGELMHRASDVSTKSFRFLEVYATLAVLYLAVLLPFSYAIRGLERHSLLARRS
jgi:polar amino acid transport system permease protein